MLAKANDQIMDYHGNIVDFHGNIMDYHGNIMDFHGNIMDFHGLSWIIMVRNIKFNILNYIDDTGK